MRYDAILGDGVDYMRSLPDLSVEGVVTSPPYNIGALYSKYEDRRKDYAEWTLVWLTEAVRISKKGVMLNIDSSPSNQVQLYKTLGAIADYFTIQNSIIWVKSINIQGRTMGHIKPVNGKRYLNHGHELILHVVSRLVDVDRLSVGVPYSDKSNIDRFSGSGGNDLRCAGTVWFEPYTTRREKLHHPASFPVSLASRMIRYLGGTGKILDPFMGSGSTLEAAQSLGRDSIGIDIDEDYVNMTSARLAKSIKIKDYQHEI